MDVGVPKFPSFIDIHRFVPGYSNKTQNKLELPFMNIPPPMLLGGESFINGVVGPLENEVCFMFDLADNICPWLSRE